MILAGQRYALDPTYTEDLDEKWDQAGAKIRPKRTEHAPDPQPREPEEPEKTIEDTTVKENKEIEEEE